MNKGRLLQVIAASSAILLGAAATSAAMAQEGMGYGAHQQPAAQQPPMVPKTTIKTSTTVSNTTARGEIAKAASDAIDLAKKQDYQGALAKIKVADAVTDKNPYEEYLVSKLLGKISAQLHDDAGAATAMDRAVASNGAPQEEIADTVKLDMGLNINAHNYAKAVSAGEQLQQLGPLDGAAAGDFALAYYMKGDYPNALKTAKSALQLQSANGGTPMVPTLEILMNSQIKTNDRAGANRTLATLCGMPSPPAELKCSQVAKPK